MYVVVTNTKFYIMAEYVMLCYILRYFSQVVYYGEIKYTWFPKCENENFELVKGHDESTPRDSHPNGMTAATFKNGREIAPDMMKERLVDK